MFRAPAIAVVVLLASSTAFADPVRYQYSFGAAWGDHSGDLSGIDAFDSEGALNVARGYLRFTVTDDIDPIASVITLPESYLRFKMGSSTMEASGPMTVTVRTLIDPGSDVTYYDFCVRHTALPGLSFCADTNSPSALEAMLGIHTDEGVFGNSVTGYNTSTYELNADGSNGLSGYPRQVSEPSAMLLASLGIATLCVGRYRTTNRPHSQNRFGRCDAVTTRSR